MKLKDLDFAKYDYVATIGGRERSLRPECSRYSEVPSDVYYVRNKKRVYLKPLQLSLVKVKRERQKARSLPKPCDVSDKGFKAFVSLLKFLLPLHSKHNLIDFDGLADTLVKMFLKPNKDKPELAILRNDKDWYDLREDSRRTGDVKPLGAKFSDSLKEVVERLYVVKGDRFQDHRRIGRAFIRIFG